MTSPPASGTWRRTSVSRRSAAASTAGSTRPWGRARCARPARSGPWSAARRAGRPPRRRPWCASASRRRRPGRAPGARRRRAAPRRSRRCSRTPSAGCRPRPARSATNGIGVVSERNGVPVSDSRRVARSKASRMPSPHDRASPPWWISSRMTRVGVSLGAAAVQLRLRGDLRRRSPRRRRSRATAGRRRWRTPGRAGCRPGRRRRPTGS